jgi:hypothetical protein
MSEFGTFRTWPVELTMSAHRGKTDLATERADFRNWAPSGLECRSRQ